MSSRSKTKGVFFILLPFTYLASVALTGMGSYSFIGTIHDTYAFDEFKPVTTDSIFTKWSSNKGVSKVSYFFLHNNKTILLIPLDTTALPDSYMKIYFSDSTQSNTVTYKNLPVFYSSKSKTAYYLKNSGLWTKGLVFKHGAWLIYLIVTLIVFTFFSLQLVKREINKQHKTEALHSVRRVSFIYTISLLLLIALGFVNWRFGKFAIIGVSFFLIPLLSLWLAIRAVPSFKKVSGEE